MSVLLPEQPGQAGCSPGTPSPQSITFSACLSCCCGSPRGRGLCKDGNWMLASLLQQVSVSGHLPCLEPQRQVGSDAWFLFWAVHTLEERWEALTHAVLMFLDVFAFVSLWYLYAKSIHVFFYLSYQAAEKRAELHVSILPNNSPVHATRYL